VRADAVHQRGVQHVHPLAPSEQAGLAGPGERAQRANGDVDGRLLRTADGTADPVEQGAARLGTNGRRFALAIAAPLVAGAAITYELWSVRSFTTMAPAWLLLYGAGVITGGMFSAPVVRTLGACFMTAGIAAVLTPPAWGNVWLGIGFGGLHVGFGAYIARNHGG